MNKPPIRVALIGYGLGGRVFHAPFISAVPGLELTAIVQRRGDEAANTYPATRILRSIDEALTDPNIDLIVVSTPNETHFDLALRALQAGKHVVVDKPFATSSKDARTLLELAKTSGKVLAPFHNRRYDGDFLTIRKLLAEGTLGRVATIDARYERFRPLQRPNSWKETNGFINGLLFDLGPHLVDQALALFGQPIAITASVRSDRDQSEIDDAFDILMEFPGSDGYTLRYGCHATMLAADPGARFTLHGTFGSYGKFGVDPQEAALIAGARPPMLGSATPWLPEPESAWGTLKVATRRTEPVEYATSRYPTVTGDYREFYVGVRDAIQGAINGVAPLPIPPQDGYRVIQMLELARASSEARATLQVDLD